MSIEGLALFVDHMTRVDVHYAPGISGCHHVLDRRMLKHMSCSPHRYSPQQQIEYTALRH